MFKVNSVVWSGDNKYILSGSSDHNIRIWKARASEKLGIVSFYLMIFFLFLKIVKKHLIL